MPLRQSALVRATHWINSLSFFALIVSGIAILIAHPRFYWGETGTLGTASLFDLPIPFTFGHSGWGRYLHFLAAWVCVFNGLLYAVTGFLTRHFRSDFPQSYTILQRSAYLAVVFALFPAMILTGLAMSPAITSVVPALVTVMGGQQSARTLHFLVTNLLIVFFLIHVVKVTLAAATKEPS